MLNDLTAGKGDLSLLAWQDLHFGHGRARYITPEYGWVTEAPARVTSSFTLAQLRSEAVMFEIANSQDVPNLARIMPPSRLKTKRALRRGLGKRSTSTNPMPRPTGMQTSNWSSGDRPSIKR